MIVYRAARHINAAVKKFKRKGENYTQEDLDRLLSTCETQSMTMMEEMHRPQYRQIIMNQKKMRQIPLEPGTEVTSEEDYQRNRKPLPFNPIPKEYLTPKGTRRKAHITNFPDVKDQMGVKKG